MTFKKFLYVVEHDMSFGDSLTNFHSHISFIKDKYPFSIIYVIVHPRTFNTGVTNLLIDKGLIDFAFPLELGKINSDNNIFFKTHLLNLGVDYVVVNKHTSQESVNLFIQLFKNVEFLQTPESSFGIGDLFEYFKISFNEEYLKILKKSYHTDYVSQFTESCISVSNNKKTVALFSGSTRVLANLGKEGVRRISELTFKLNQHLFLVGTSKYNLYNVNEGVNWSEIYNCDYQTATNLIGNNWSKTISLLKRVDMIISGPTGAAMISPLINKKQILILGGDSPIMKDCINGYTYNEYTLNLKCNCVNYPCGINLVKTNKELYDTCFTQRNAKCLNENLNINDLQSLLEKI